MAPMAKPSMVWAQKLSTRPLRLNSIWVSLRSRRGASSRTPPCHVPLLAWSTTLEVVGGDERCELPALDLEEEHALGLDVAVLGEHDLLGDGVLHGGEPLDVLEQRLALRVPGLDALQQDVGG